MAMSNERDLFNEAFMRWLLVPGSTCWERDVLRAGKEQLWAHWEVLAALDAVPKPPESKL